VTCAAACLPAGTPRGAVTVRRPDIASSIVVVCAPTLGLGGGTEEEEKAAMWQQAESGRVAHLSLAATSPRAYDVRSET
jgi:hypothetical protein